MGRKRDKACKCGKMHKSKRALLQCHVSAILTKISLKKSNDIFKKCLERSIPETDSIKYTFSNPPKKYLYFKKIEE
jgi:hypothetical protein